MRNNARKIIQESFPGIYFLADKHKVIVKYLISGGTATITDLGILYILTDLAGMWYIMSAVLSFAIAFFVSFFLQKFWTFRDTNREQIHKQMSLYLLVALINLGINTWGMYVLVEWAHLWYMLAQVVMGGLVACGSFLIYKFFIFKTNETDGNKQSGKKLKILIATGIFPPDIGGPATYTKTLREELPKFGWEVKVITYSDWENTECRMQNAESVFCVSRKQNKLIRYLKYFWQVYKLITWANIVYAQGPVSEGLPVWLACKLRGKKYVLKVVGDYAWEQGQQRFSIKELLDEFQNKKYGIRLEVIRFAQKTVARSADKIIVPSEYLKKIVSQWGINEEKIKVIYNAAELQAAASAAKPEKEKWLISIGRLVPWKGFECLIKLMPDLLKREPDLKLKIIGDGPEKEKLKVQSEKLNVAGAVLLLGKLPHEQTLSYLKAADVFALNTGYEGLSHLLLEATHAAVPIVATNVGGNPEVIKHNQNGILVEYNNQTQLQDAILRLLNDGELAQKLTTAGKESLNKFSRENMIATTVEFLTKAARI